MISRRLTMLAVILSLGASAASASASGPKVGKIFDCYAYKYGLGLSYIQAVQFKTGSSYLVAPFRKDNHLSGRPAKGSYKLRGNRILFQTGPFAHYTGDYIAGSRAGRARFALSTASGQANGESCYQH